VHHRRPQQGSAAVHEVELALTFEQAALGAMVPFKLPEDEPCDACGATGTTVLACRACDGAGSTVRASGAITIRHVCDECEGSGARRMACEACGGSGHRTGSREVTVRVPPGVDDGTHLRVPIPHTDATVLAAVRTSPHEYFARRGRDLTLDLPVTVAEAALGAVVTVPTLTDAVAIRLPAGTPHGRVLRVRGRGIPFDDGPSDLLVTVDVVIPAELNDDQRAALEAFAAATESPRKRFERRNAPPGT
jgi:molecular chaperone DnaJ